MPIFSFFIKFFSTLRRDWINQDQNLRTIDKIYKVFELNKMANTLKIWKLLGVHLLLQYKKFQIMSLLNTNYCYRIFTDVINALEGLIFFLILVVFRKKIIHDLANKKICGRELPLLKIWKHLEVSECEDLQPTTTEVPMETFIKHQ